MDNLDKAHRLKQEKKKSKKPYKYDTIQGDCPDMEKIWTNFAIQLEKFKKYYLDAL